MRLDKFLSECGYSRKTAVEMIKNGEITVNFQKITQKDYKINENTDEIYLGKNKLEYSKFVYIMINKPSGVLSATEDRNQKTVLDLLPEIYQNKNLFPVGRLDKDTVGLLILTNDGDFCHKLISPKHNIEKKYYFELADLIDEQTTNDMQNGVELKDGYKTMPCIIEMIDDTKGFITIKEGKYHQIKRMFASVGNKIVFLERVSEGGLVLDKSLKRGEWKLLKKQEIDAIFN